MTTLIDTPAIACPNHNGSFDCTPFCKLCEGNQETDLDTLLDYAFSVSWDTCHKIYLNMDVQQHNKMVGYGYEATILNNNPWLTKQEVREWYDNSCSLRFIDALFTEDYNTDRFVTVVPQFFSEEEDDE